MSEKKLGPREQQLREMREGRVSKNKALIDKTIKKGLKVVKPIRRSSGRGR